MADQGVYDVGRFDEAFSKFVEALEKHLTIQPDDRLLDQYIQFRDAVLKLLKSDGFRDQLRQATRFLITNGGPDFIGNEQIVIVLQKELEATTRSAEIAHSLQGETGKKPWLRKLFSRASTANGSVKDIFDEILKRYPLLRGGLIVFGELLDLFKGA